ncbi:hypothetical protein F5Y14DRAFT_441321 [Nemania sp. NC0429]|nr:hypothetical protein F5Y14DRAFT_441321 [Nemania sp. NC0429]
MALQSDQKDTLVIGIDFGTTFTGVAYACVKPGTEAITPQPVTLWPAPCSDDAAFDSPKVPSRIEYTGDGHVKWGQEASDAGILWFKLLLLDEHDLQLHLRNSDHLRQARENLETTGKDIVTVISDYLKNVWAHAIGVIARAWGQTFVHTRPFHVIVTVPAIWQDYAIQRMRDALKKAGILDRRPGCEDTTYEFIPEPEAAALAAIEAHGKLPGLSPGQTFVIADLGGGTVDLISFRVKSTQPHLRLEEAVEGEGALCGATFLDQAFLTYFEKKLKNDKKKNKRLREWQKMDKEDRKRIIDIEWEQRIKRKYYDGRQIQPIYLGAQGNRRPYIQLENDNVNDVFGSVYNDISKLIHGQVEAIAKKTSNMPQFIVLTGGFGGCEYIYRKLCQEHEGSIEILSEGSEKAWTAVARGAVLSGIAHISNKDLVDSHVSRYSYGWAKWENFNYWVHNLDDCEFDKLSGRCLARGQMQWIIRRGESIMTQKPHVYTYTANFEDEVGFVSFLHPVYRSSLKEPPIRLAENEIKEEESVRQGEPADFREHARIKITTPVPVEQLPKGGDAEHPYRMLHLQVEVNISGASLVIKVTSGEKTIGEMVIDGL